MALKVSTETYLIVDSYDLDNFIKEVTGHEFESVALEEWSNDSSHQFNIRGKPDNRQQEKWAKFCSTGKQENYLVRTALECLAAEGKISPGTYLIQVCW